MDKESCMEIIRSAVQNSSHPGPPDDDRFDSTAVITYFAHQMLLSPLFVAPFVYFHDSVHWCFKSWCPQPGSKGNWWQTCPAKNRLLDEPFFQVWQRKVRLPVQTSEPWLVRWKSVPMSFLKSARFCTSLFIMVRLICSTTRLWISQRDESYGSGLEKGSSTISLQSASQTQICGS